MLKRLIKQSGKTYADAAAVLQLSEQSVKRLFMHSDLSLERIERICDWLRMSLSDVVQQSEGAQPLLTELDATQGTELHADPELLLVTVLMLNRWSEEEILETFRFQKLDLARKLARIGLIEKLPTGRIKVRISRNFSWRKDAPIHRLFSQRVLPEFLDTRFDQPGERMQFVGGLLSRASVQKMHEAIDDLARQLDELVRQDEGLALSERHGVTLFVGFRPWEFSEFTKLRRQPRETFS